MIDRDMYNTYDGIPLPYHDVYHFNTEEYLENKNKSTYTWDFGDTVKLKFQICPCYRQSLIKGTIFNFRGEPIFEISDYLDDDNIFYINIDSTVSKNYFTKGTYSCRIQSLVPINEAENEVTTIMPADACTFYVR